MPPVLERPSQKADSLPVVSRWTRATTLLLLGVLMVSTVIILRGIRTGEFSYNVDEAQHGVTGLYAAAMLHDHPAHPVDYTYNFYAQYPALGVVHWPPVFYGFEGLSFLLLGPGVVAARLTILFFTLFGLSAWFFMVRDLQDDWMAALSTVLLALLPGLLLFEKTVMLEIPCLSLCIAATACWGKYLFHEKKSSLAWFTVFASAALLTKQNSVYLPVFCLLSAVAVGSWRFLLRPPVQLSAAVVGMVSGPYYLLVYRTHWQSAVAIMTDKATGGNSPWMFYWKSLPGQLGWMVMGLFLLGLLTSSRWDRKKSIALMLSWIVACYVTFTLIGLKDARYTLYWLPPFTYFAAGVLTRLFTRPPLRAIASAAAVICVASSLAFGWTFHRPYVTGYAAAAKAVTQAAPGGIILYDGDLPGNFIFYVSVNDPHRHFLVLRKALYAFRIDKRAGSEQLVYGADGIEDLLRRDGIRFIVVSEHMQMDFDVQHILRDMLKSKQFKLLGTFPVFSSQKRPEEDLLLYENEEWAPPADKFLKIRMMSLNHDLVVPFSQFELTGYPGQPAAAGAK
jgi:hypothetical protein